MKERKNLNAEFLSLSGSLMWIECTHLKFFFTEVSFLLLTAELHSLTYTDRQWSFPSKPEIWKTFVKTLECKKLPDGYSRLVLYMVDWICIVS